MKRTVALLLAVAIVVTMIPMLTFGVAAASDGILSESELVSDNIKLGKGFNVLSGKQLIKENVATGVIFENPTFLTPRVSGASSTEYYYTYINDANSFLKNQSSKLDASLDASVQIYMVSVEADVKYGLETNHSSSGSENKEYIALSAVASRKKYYYRPLTTADKKALWNTVGVLSESFKEEISQLQTDADIAAFFAKYGTHIITSYTAGGEACYTYSGEKVEAAESMSVDENISVSAGVSVGAFGSVKASVDMANHMDSSGTSASTNVSAYGYQKGGVGIPFKDTDVAEWEKTIDDTSMEILVNDSLQLMPVWDLLVEDIQADLKVRLKNYFEKQLGTGYTGVDSLMGKTDYSDYTFITDAQGLDAIRNDLGGKYVLLCDIDLSEYSQWTPIGESKEEAFTGVLDGNGNIVTGLKVTQSVNGAAGLFGYIGATGELRNLTVAGTVSVDAASIGYAGGLAGYSNGMIKNCRSNVIVNGKLTAEASAVEKEEDSTWFEINHGQIEEAKLVTATVAENDAQYNTFPLKLTGSAENITISVPDSGKTAYIILENAQLVGTICSVNGNTRPVCIISMGDSNTFVAPDSTVAVNTPNAGVYITGEAPLTVQGGNGSDGNNGAEAASSSNKNGTNGANGEDAGHGAAGVVANQLIIDATSFCVYGGNGGNGGHASNGTDGKDVSGTCKSDYGTSGSCRGAVGGTGGAGGNGGDGGNGAVPVSVNGIRAYGQSKVVMHYGKNGDGGNGGSGGKGGRGQNGANGWCVAGIEPGHDGGHGGAGGKGGDGGSAGTVALLDYGKITELFRYASVIVDKTAIFSGTGGTGGAGGKGGDGGTGGAEIHNWFYDIGQHPGVAGDGGNGGRGGDGGDGGSGYVCKTGALAGEGGARGSRGKTEDNCGHHGQPGEKGYVGDDGVITISDSTTSKALLLTNAKEYNVHSASVTWDGVHTLLNGQTLVSIGSQKEQQLIEQLISHTSGNKYWIGLRRNLEKGYNIFDWTDGTTLKIQEDTFGADAVASLIDSNGQDLCSAYSGWASGQPDNADSIEQCVYVDELGAWYDTETDTPAVGYITEETLITESANSKDKNTVFLGGICGFADTESEISGCINNGKVAAGANSEEYGITACSGGIAGMNHGSIRSCVSAGAVEAISLSASSAEYSDAYAAQIAGISASGTVSGCYSDVEPVAYAVSGSGLSNPNSVKDATAGNALVQELEALWSSDPLRITAVDPEKSTYYCGDVFDKSSVTVTYEGIEISRFKVNYYFKDGATSANVVISYEDAVRILPVKLKALMPVELRFTEARQTFFYNEAFNADGLIVDLYYNTGASRSFTAESPEITVSAPDMTKLGTQTVTVTYRDDAVKLQCSYEIEIRAIPLEGSVHIDGMAVYGQTLTVNVNGITTEGATYTVAWYKNGEQQPLSTAKSITVIESMIDQSITVAVTGIGYYQGTLTSEAVIPSRGESDAPTSLTVSKVTDTTVELQIIAGAEYRCEDGQWQADNVFTELEPNTQYRFYARYAKTGTTNESSASLPLYVTTMKTSIGGGISLPTEAYAGERLTADLSALRPAGATVIYQWYADGVAIKDATDSTYEVKASDAGKSVFVRVSGTGKYDGFLDSNPVAVKAGTLEENAPQIVLSGASAAKGNTFTAQISVRNNPGFNALNLAVMYDSDILTLVDVENLTTELTLTKGASYFLDSADNYCENGGLLQLTFKVSDDVPAGEYELQLKLLGASNDAFEEVKMAAVSGVLTVFDVVYGDTNGDGSVTTADLSMLRRYLATMNGTSPITVKAGGDVNGDGQIDMIDIAMLRKYFASIDPMTGASSVVLGPQGTAGGDAEGKLLIRGSQSAASAGGQVTVDIILEDNPGVSALNLYYVYDKANLTLKQVTNKVPSFTMTNDATTVWDAAGDESQNGVLATLTFDVAENAPAGDYEIRICFVSAANDRLQAVSAATVSGTVTVTAQGGTLSGRITSYGGADDEVTVQLFEENSDSVYRSVTLQGADYTISDVAYGTYTVKVSKNNHVTRTYTICVDSDAAKLDMKICLLGDVTGDGRVNVGDTAKLYSHIRKTAVLTDEYQLLCANVNGGSLNVGDVAGIYSHIRGTKKLY